MFAMFADVRYAFRNLRNNPGFAGAAILTLAIAIGATTAIFAAVDAALLRSLPYQDVDRLVFLWEVDPADAEERPASYPDYADWRRSETLEDIAGFNIRTPTIDTDVGPERIVAGRVTANFFPLLGVEAFLGRTFHASEDVPGSDRVVLLNHDAWRNRFGADPEIVGRTIRLSDEPMTVIGVLPRTFHFAPLGEAEMWVPFAATPDDMAPRTRHWISAFGRLAPGVTTVQAQGDLDRIAANIATEHADSHRDTSIRLVPLRDQVVGPVEPVLVTLMVSVGLVLLVACSNVASLLLVRSSAREQEFATRLALGAEPSRLRRQLITESLVLSALGGAGALAIAHFALPVLLAAVPGSLRSTMPFLAAAAIDVRIFAFCLAVSGAAALAFGVAPSIGSARHGRATALRQRAGIGAGRHLREIVIVGQLALAMVLVTGAGLSARSLAALLDVDLGFNPRNLLTMQITVPASAASEGRAAVLLEELVRRLDATPGVVASAHIDRMPLEGGNSGGIIVEGSPQSASEQPPSANIRVVSRNYFDTMGIALVAGRGFTDRDRVDVPRVAVINETLARRVFGETSSAGRRIAFSFMPDQGFEVVGVVADERVEGLDVPLTGVIYSPYSQLLPYRNSPSVDNTLLVRTAGEPLALADLIRREITAVDAGFAVHGVETMARTIVDSPASFSRRYPTLLLGVFATIALALTMVGVYGVFAYTVSRRSAELGLRLALGAGNGSIYRAVMGRGLAQAGVGIAIGMAGSLALAGAFRTLLFGIEPTDPITFAAAAATLVVAAAAACYVPARRAVRIDPAITLRE